MKKNNQGFSLVELIIVIAIMAVLVGVLAPQFIKYVESSRQSTDIDNVQSLKSSVESYVADKLITSGNFEITVNGGNASVSGTGIAAETNELGITDTAGSLKLKSSAWPNVTWTYNTSTFKWTGSDCRNGNKPNKNMNTVFDNTAS